MKMPVGTKIATIDGTTQIEGESYALGWNAAANYAFDDKNEIGVVYRSRIKHSLEADLIFSSKSRFIYVMDILLSYFNPIILYINHTLLSTLIQDCIVN